MQSVDPRNCKHGSKHARMVHITKVLRKVWLTSPYLFHSIGICRFDIRSFDFASNEDESGMLRTVSSVNQLISAEVDSGVASERIVVGGFSQGAAMSLLTGFTTERKLGGIVSLSGWTVLRNKLKAVSGIRILGNTL
jgi:predicted esterase